VPEVPTYTVVERAVTAALGGHSVAVVFLQRDVLGVDVAVLVVDGAGSPLALGRAGDLQLLALVVGGQDAVLAGRAGAQAHIVGIDVALAAHQTHVSRDRNGLGERGGRASVCQDDDSATLVGAAAVVGDSGRRRGSGLRRRCGRGCGGIQHDGGGRGRGIARRAAGAVQHDHAVPVLIRGRGAIADDRRLGRIRRHAQIACGHVATLAVIAHGVPAAVGAVRYLHHGARLQGIEHAVADAGALAQIHRVADDDGAVCESSRSRHGENQQQSHKSSYKVFAHETNPSFFAGDGPRGPAVRIRRREERLPADGSGIIWRTVRAQATPRQHPSRRTGCLSHSF